MKKIFAVLLLVMTAVSMLVSCGSQDDGMDESYYDLIISEDSKDTVTTTASPEKSGKDTSSSKAKKQSSSKVSSKKEKSPKDSSASTSKKSGKQDTSGKVTSSVADSVSSEYVEYRFRTKKLRDQHYEKHGKEMGFKSADEYRKAASDVVNSPDALHKTEKEDGDDVYYLEETNEFVVVSKDGYLRTYFNPDGGKSYFDRQ